MSERNLDEATAELLRALQLVPIAERWKLPREVRKPVIAALALAGRSSTAIGVYYGVSRNAVIGFAHRWKVPLGGSPSRQATATGKRSEGRNKPFVVYKSRAEATVNAARRKNNRAVIAPTKPTIVALPSYQSDIEGRASLTMFESPTAVNILDVGMMQCRYPLWGLERKPTVAEMMYCGDAKEDGDILKAYCRACARRMKYRGNASPEIVIGRAA